MQDINIQKITLGVLGSATLYTLSIRSITYYTYTTRMLYTYSSHELITCLSVPTTKLKYYSASVLV